MRLERASERFARCAEEPGAVKSQRKRHRPEGEEEQLLAPPASSNYREGGGSCSGSALPPPPAPPPLEPPPIEKRGLDQETEMTDATVEQQGEPEGAESIPKGLKARDSSSSSSSSSSSNSSECSTDTEMGLVDVCTILSEAEGSHLGGPITLDLTKWDFSKTDCRNTCRNW